MEHSDNIPDRFNEVSFTLSREDIVKFDQEDNGPINNVISRINRHCFGVKLFDDEKGLATEMFYINNDNELKGDIICLDLNDPDYFQLLLRFCSMLSNDYDDIDAINAFNILQTRLRSFLEKRGFKTTTTLELKQFRGQHAVIMCTSPRGIKNITLIDRVEFYRDFFNNNFDAAQVPDKEYVYLMVNDDTSFIKIGTSKNPGYREKTLHSQEPNIHIIALWCCSKAIEKELHKKFDSKRVRGEWFRLTFAELKEIEDFMTLRTSNSS
jgi:Meiotically up-regulated gene 113